MTDHSNKSLEQYLGQPVQKFLVCRQQNHITVKCWVNHILFSASGANVSISLQNLRNRVLAENKKLLCYG